MQPNTNYIIFTTDFPPMIGGVADYSFNLAKYLNQEGKLNQVITTVQGVNSSNIPITHISPPNERQLGKRLGDRFSLTRKINTLLHITSVFLSAVINFRTLLHRSNKVIVTSYYGYIPEQYVKALRSLKIEYILVLHGLDIIWNVDYNKKNFIKLLLKSNKVVFNSRATYNLLHAHTGVYIQNPLIVYPSLDTGELSKINILPIVDLENRLNIKLEKKLVLTFLARLVKRKGAEDAIKVAVKLKESFPDIVLLICGKGPEFETLANIIKEKELQEFVKLVGYVDEELKSSILFYSSIYLMPTKTLQGNDFEGFGISYLEAAYYGNLVVGGLHGGITEAIQHNVNGLLYKFDEPDAVDQAVKDLKRLLVSPKEYDEIVQNSRRFSERYTWESQIKVFLEGM